jgi:hypothetical protein
MTVVGVAVSETRLVTFVSSAWAAPKVEKTGQAELQEVGKVDLKIEDWNHDHEIG